MRARQLRCSTIPPAAATAAQRLLPLLQEPDEAGPDRPGGGRGEEGSGEETDEWGTERRSDRRSVDGSFNQLSVRSYEQL